MSKGKRVGLGLSKMMVKDPGTIAKRRVRLQKFTMSKIEKRNENMKRINTRLEDMYKNDKKNVLKIEELKILISILANKNYRISRILGSA